MIHFTDMYRAGYIPSFLSEDDPRPAKEQIESVYIGGWYKFEGFTLHKPFEEWKSYLTYPGDPPMREVSRAKLRDETLILFEASWFAIVQPDGSHEIARVD